MVDRTKCPLVAARRIWLAHSLLPLAAVLCATFGAAYFSGIKLRLVFALHDLVSLYAEKYVSGGDFMFSVGII